MSSTAIHPLLTGDGEAVPAWQLRVQQAMFGAMYLFLASCFISIAVNSLSLGVIGLTFVLLMVAQHRFLVRPTPLDWFFAAYVLAEALSALFSSNHLQAFQYSKRLLLIGIVYWFATWIATEQMAKRVMAVLLGTAALVAVFGAGIVVLEHPLRLGIFQFYMTTSELMMFSALMILPFAIHPKTPGRIRWLAIASLLPVLFSLYSTVTKGAYLAFAAGVVLIALMRNWKLILPFLAVVVLLVVYAPPYVHDRLEGIVDIHHPENAERLRLWSTGLRLIAAHPVLGVGDIDLHDVYMQYMSPGDPTQYGHLHNMALQFLATLGIVGFLVVVAMFARIAQCEWRVYRRVRDEWFRGSVVLGALAVFVGLQVAGLSEWTFGDQEVVIVFWISVGMALAASSWTPLKGGADA